MPPSEPVNAGWLVGRMDANFGRYVVVAMTKCVCRAPRRRATRAAAGFICGPEKHLAPVFSLFLCVSLSYVDCALCLLVRDT